MSMKERVTVSRVTAPKDRTDALAVLDAVYAGEKRWVGSVADVLPENDLAAPGVAWFVTRVDGKPVGVVRVLFDLPVDLYRQYGFTMLADGLDVERFIRTTKIAEVGRFAVLPEWRAKVLVAASLIRACAGETVARGYTHMITDVIENDPNSPYEFHTRVLGFVPVASHEHGELRAAGRRITMLLDLPQAYQRVRSSRSWLFRYIFESFPTDAMEEMLRERTVNSAESA
jgi:hypothetical protein